MKRTGPRPRPGRGLLAAWLKVPGDAEEEFNDWYNTEHLPQLVSVGGVLRARRYRSMQDDWYLALYDLERPEVFAGRHFQAVIGNPTPWSRRMRRLYGSNRIRCVYEVASSVTVTDGGGPSPPYLAFVRVAAPEAVGPAFEARHDAAVRRCARDVAGLTTVRRLVEWDGNGAHAVIGEGTAPLRGTIAWEALWTELSLADLRGAGLTVSDDQYELLFTLEKRGPHPAEERDG